MSEASETPNRRRCETDACDIDGRCSHCGAANGEVCRDPYPQDGDGNVLLFTPKPRKFWPVPGSFDGSAA